MHQRIREAIKLGSKLFSRKAEVDSLWQEIAINFYPERADFTETRSWGEEFADHLFSSYPVIARRELGNLFASNLRPRSTKWLGIHVNDEALDEDIANRRYLEYLTTVQWRAMYDPASQFVRATKEADHDFAAFGNAVIKASVNSQGNGLLYTAYHLRDCAWSENSEGVVDAMHRNWEPTARQLKHFFGDKVSKNVQKACEKDPEKTFKCRHMVLPTQQYEYQTKGGKEYPYSSLYVEIEGDHVLEEVGLNYFPYVVPRWQTVPGTPYGRSMATTVALPDGRTMQVVLRVLREAGEKFVDPPMIAVTDAIRSDVALYPGGVTTADIEYDERLGDVLRPISQDKSGMPIGFEIAAALREDIRSAFMLDKIQLPEMQDRTTAFEISRRLQEHIRASAPVFEPIEQQYNAPLCELTFEILRENGAFGPVEDMPPALSGADIEFKFRSPIADLVDANDAQVFVQGFNEIVMPAAQVDPAQLENVDLTQGVRDALKGAGFKAHWLKPIQAVQQKKEQLEKQAEMAMGMDALSQGTQAAEQGSRAVKTVVEAESEAAA